MLFIGDFKKMFFKNRTREFRLIIGKHRFNPVFYYNFVNPQLVKGKHHLPQGKLHLHSKHHLRSKHHLPQGKLHIKTASTLDGGGGFYVKS